MVWGLILSSGVCLAAFLHPYVTYPLSLRLLPRRPWGDAALPRPSATLMFAAYNEERALPAKLANLAAIKALHPDLEIVAYCDMSTDRTLALLEERPDLLRVVPATERTGKAAGMARMVAQARGDVCIFTDANVIVEPASIAALLDHFRDPAIGGVSGVLHYVNAQESETARVGGLYWRLEEHIKALESRSGSMMGADGAIFAVRRSLYPAVPPELLDDMIASMSVIFAGTRLVSAPDVIASERNTTDSRDEFRRKRRIAARAYATHRHLRPMMKAHFGLLARYEYVSHKLLRWFGAPILLAALLLLTAALLLLGQPLAAVALWALPAFGFALGRAGVPVLAPLSEIALSILAAFLGVLDALRGRSYRTWQPAKSRD